MNVSPNFTLYELTHSDTADRLGIANVPDEGAKSNLSRLCFTALEPARAISGQRLGVTNAYRCLELNAAVGGVPNSAHPDGRGADVVPLDGMGCPDLFDIIRRSAIPYDQVILETTDDGKQCVHISVARFGDVPRRQALIRLGTFGHWTYEVAA